MFIVQVTFTAPKRSGYGDTFTSPQLRERLFNEAEYIIITHDNFVEEANKLATHHRTHTTKIIGLDLI